eukprot:GDKK01021748.1.p1 GENE.GDKK01021748.1~~GDKK01021748.1.p1  ORF type:complete len:752 (+),score=188.22 GDKK01021748.1:291-2258(+)
MDSMELERERGITIQSAASFCEWNVDSKRHFINVIDTPGHVDFTVEVERALRVLDGGVLLLCGVAGVQSQTMTVFRQMQRYEVPRLVFINKMDRDGADAFRAIETMQRKVPQINPVPIQIPIGAQSKFQGVIDLITMKACTFEGYKGSERVFSEIPENLKEKAAEYREKLLSALADLDDDFAEKYLEESFTEEDIHEVIRKNVIARKFSPVLMGTAHKNKGIQNLLDCVGRYLPSPLDVTTLGFDQSNDSKEVEVVVKCEEKAPLVAYAFKIQESPIGQVTYMRIYQGVLKRNDQILNMQTGKKIAAKKLLKMHADEAKEISLAKAGDIVAILGVDCASGTTFTDGKTRINLMSMFIPEPVVQMSLIVPQGNDSNKLAKSLSRFQKEDPTFRVHTDAESKETILSGMGELHLDVYVERMRREYGLNVSTGEPRVNFRETIQSRTEFEYTHKRQTGGRGEYAKICGYFEPIPEDERLDRPFEFQMQLQGNVIPPNYFSSIEKGFRESFDKGYLSGCKIIGVKVVITDGQTHEVDSSDLAFRTAAEGAVKHFLEDAHPTILEPVMKVEVTGPLESSQAMLQSLQKRRGTILNTSEIGDSATVEAEVPLKEMFGYIATLRACTQGMGEFNMDFHAYEPMPGNEIEKVVAEYKARSQKK